MPWWRCVSSARPMFHARKCQLLTKKWYGLKRRHIVALFLVLTFSLFLSDDDDSAWTLDTSTRRTHAPHSRRNIHTASIHRNNKSNLTRRRHAKCFPLASNKQRSRWIHGKTDTIQLGISRLVSQAHLGRHRDLTRVRGTRTLAVPA